MFRAALTIRTPNEARLAIERLCAMLDKSDVSGTSKSFLIDSARETLELWQAQLARPSTKSLKAEKIFEGGDYRIVLKVRSLRSGIIGLLRKAIGAE
jgi:hypothetical protein